MCNQLLACENDGERIQIAVWVALLLVDLDLAAARLVVSNMVRRCLMSMPIICLLSFQNSCVLALGFGLGGLVGHLVLDLAYWERFKILLLLVLVIGLDAAISLECARLAYFMLLFTFGRGTHPLICLCPLLLLGPWLLLLILNVKSELPKAKIFFSPYESMTLR